jgi:SAM-dependent methyltransferase
LYVVSRTIRFVRGFLLSFGPQSFKQRVWDREYRTQYWQFRDHTPGDSVYLHLERYARKGSVLDLGCGSGNTATELADTAYASYLGVDISQAALVQASSRSKESGRQTKNCFVHGDFLDWEPPGRFDVILFRESMYHVPLAKVKVILDRYSRHLEDGGVFIVGVFAADLKTGQSKHRPNAMLRIVEREFEVVDKRQYDRKGQPTVLVFRPRRQEPAKVERAS